jgi:YgiT-type zinc finger domain-containing protein
MDTETQVEPAGEPEYEILCSECITGVMHMQALTYFTWLQDELITVPNFPAWVCDRCGRREWDERAINWLNALLNPSAGRRLQKRRGSSPVVQQPRP